MNDQDARRLSATPVPWDEVRQQRVLGRVEALVATRAAARRRRRWLAAGGAGLAAAAAAVAMLVLPVSPSPGETPLVMEAPIAEVGPVAVAPLPSIPFATWPELRLPDDSRAQLRHGARVDVDIHQDDLVRLIQHSGEVRYEVTPDRRRSFVVDAAGVEVRVIGTVFTVSLSDDESQVAVAVERGLVEVDNGARVAELGPGDELKVEAELLVVDDDPAPVRRASPRPAAPAPSAPIPSIESLLTDADAARASGDLARAAAALSELVRRYPKDPRAYSASFQLGNVERARGRHGAAASAFARCWKRAPRGALAEDARAETAASWHAAGQFERAHKAADDYLDRYPAGTHARRMQKLLARLP